MQNFSTKAIYLIENYADENFDIRGTIVGWLSAAYFVAVNRCATGNVLYDSIMTDLRTNLSKFRFGLYAQIIETKALLLASRQGAVKLKNVVYFRLNFF